MMYFLRNLKENVPADLWNKVQEERRDILNDVPSAGRHIAWEEIESADIPLFGNTQESDVAWRNDMEEHIEVLTQRLASSPVSFGETEMREDEAEAPARRVRTEQDLYEIMGSTTNEEEVNQLQNRVMELLAAIEAGDSVEQDESVVVSGAGVTCVNGTFKQEGTFEDATQFVKTTTWNGTEEVITIYRRQVTQHTGHWYIAIKQDEVRPGSPHEITFYVSMENSDRPDFPPSTGWSRAMDGATPCPTLHIEQQTSVSEVASVGSQDTHDA